MGIRIGRGDKAARDQFDAEFQEAFLEHSQNPTAKTHERLVMLYERSTGYKGGCGACRNGRALMMRGLTQMASGDLEGGKSTVRGAFASVGFKTDMLKRFLGL